MIKNITVSGDIGTGKSTLAKALAQKLNWNYFSAGDYFRQWHKDNSIPLDYTDIPEEVDLEFDKLIKEKILTEKDTVFEWRLAGCLGKDLKESFKILCVADKDVALERVSKRDEMGIEETKEKLVNRSRGLEKKFKKLYGVDDYLNPKYFDLVVDTTIASKEDVLEKVLSVVYQKL